MKGTLQRLANTLRGDGLRARLIRGAFGSVGLKIANALLGVAVAILLARALGPEGYGVYAFALSLVTLLAIPAQMGLPTLMVRETVKYHYQEQWGLLRGLLRQANQVALGFSLVLGLIAAGVAWSLSSHADPVQIETYLWALLLVPLIALGNLRGATLRGLHRLVQGQLPEMVLRPAFLLLLGGITAMVSTLTPQGTMALHALASGLAFAIGAALLWRALPSETRDAQPVYETTVWGRSVLPLSLLAGLQIINSQTGIVMLGFLATNEAVGIYRVVTQVATLVVFSLSAVNMVIAPHVAQLYAARNKQRLQRMTTWSARGILLIAVPVSGVFILFGEPILGLVFGSEYRAGHTALAILCVGQLLNAAMGSVGILLNMSGYERDTARGVAVAAVVNMLLNMILIPVLGMNGAATATAVTLLIWNAVLCRQVWVRLGIQSTVFRFAGERSNGLRT
ncbi:MAG: flippase [Gammaproteobacteria bacterium]